jgi:hypothetical protein
MRKVLFLFLFFKATFIFSQINYHFPTSNTTWFETFNNQYGQNSYYTYFMLNSDTVINGKVSHNLFTQNYLNDSVKIGCIREDSLTKVFFYDYSSNYEFLLYDFSKSIGDTIFYGTNSLIIPFDYLYNYVIITNIDTVLIGTNYRRRFYTNAGYQEVWIEGIGSYRSLLSPITQPFTCLCSWSLNCIMENDSLYCLPQTLVSIDNNSDIPKYKVEIFPNPTNSAIVISLDKYCESINVEVYNLQGKLITKKDYSNCKNIPFNLADSEHGVYFLKLTLDDKAMETGKIVISE